MRLLIVTQAVDQDDPVLGFFHRWLEEFAKHAEAVEVVCLYEGRHALPKNVRVHSLGKEQGARPALVYALRFLSLIGKLRASYDAVFVHMNAEYVLLGAPLWKLWRKRVALWYLHGTVSARLRFAVALADVILTSSPESMRVATKKKRIVGHGVDTETFRPDPGVSRGTHLLSLGRLMPRKRHELAIAAAALLERPLRIVGEGPERASLEALAKRSGADVSFLGGLSHGAVVKEYQEAAWVLHTSATGSMDKVVLEALAAGAEVVTTSQVYKGFPLAVVEATPEAIAAAVKKGTTHPERAAYVREHYALATLIPRILATIS